MRSLRLILSNGDAFVKRDTFLENKLNAGLFGESVDFFLCFIINTIV
jgi:hypothetical protein